MATYKEIQDFVLTTRGYTPKSCWIADVKEEHHLTTRRAPNRKDEDQRSYPCPETKRPDIVTAFKHFGML
ncbi:MAG: hypothetical protein WEB63_06665 [Cucumibacter sp.]